MAKVYFNRLIVGTITYDAIPEKYQDKVRKYGVEYVKKENFLWKNMKCCIKRNIQRVSN